MSEPNEIIAEQVVNQVQTQQAAIGQTLADTTVGIAGVGGEIILEVAADDALDTALDTAVNVAGEVLGGIFDLF